MATSFTVEDVIGVNIEFGSAIFDKATQAME